MNIANELMEVSLRNYKSDKPMIDLYWGFHAAGQSYCTICAVEDSSPFTGPISKQTTDIYTRSDCRKYLVA